MNVMPKPLAVSLPSEKLSATLTFQRLEFREFVHTYIRAFAQLSQSTELLLKGTIVFGLLKFCLSSLLYSISVAFHVLHLEITLGLIACQRNDYKVCLIGKE